MQVNLNLVSSKTNVKNTSFTSDFKEKDVVLVMYEMPNDTFERSTVDRFLSDDEEDDEIAAGPYGHPYSGRPIINSGSSEEKLSLIDRIFLPRESKEPKTFIGRLFSLGDNNFDDDVSKYHAQLAKDAVKSAKGLIGKDAPIAIPVGDFNKDGIVDRIISGINQVIDITGDGKGDIIGTLIDTTGDGKANFILDQLGNLKEIDGNIVKVIGESGIRLKDLKEIPKIVAALLGSGN